MRNARKSRGSVVYIQWSIWDELRGLAIGTIGSVSVVAAYLVLSAWLPKLLPHR